MGGARRDPAASSVAPPRLDDDWVVPTALFDDDDAADRRWRERIRVCGGSSAPRWSLPRSARRHPDRSVYRSSLSGTTEIYAWDRSQDHHRQVTERPNGTLEAALSADGRDIWWFADTDGDEFGHWMREPFDAGVADPQPAVPGLPDGYDCGLAIGQHVVVVGLATEEGTTIWAVRPDTDPQVIYTHREDALVGQLSADETLVALAHSEHGDNRNPGVLVLRTSDGTRVGIRLDRDAQLMPMGFGPGANDRRLLVSHERGGRTGLLIWDLATDAETELVTSLPGDLWGRWFPDGQTLLVVHKHAGRCTLHRYDLTRGQLSDIASATGTIEDAVVRPDGAVEYLWSSGASPWAVRRIHPGTDDDQRILPTTPTNAPPSEPLEDAWVPGPGGPIHVFIARPAGTPGPYPTVFRLHGGPHAADQDSFHAMRAAWLDAGFAAVMVNFRGSTGYGPAWRNSITGRPGVTELEDVAAVQRWAIDTGLARADECVAEGYSWGGQLALLAVGMYPGDWAAAIGGLPVADAVAAYEDEMAALKAMDRALCGGSPEEVPHVYAAASPITYADQVQAPVLILAGENDPRCPIRQIENYQSVMQQLGKPLVVRRYATGHGPQDTELVEGFVLAAISFARTALEHVRSSGH
ncbi:prolyl oligopeptidase family serine peptidase (plasmid) [Pseudonocardia sp. DSM 110487]|uniref:S9 family peptidase n=1 Tax=Pseudonocardia sp. DSM 110487 TaxID=2865833 RepID=UPI001C69B503|nr:prolyl oligopeptidase family serine peptidase [Pseudonocardia sp. DSM 110487]QYN41066.1 prolyl oligopeptidase family serine peptidase [Pseudonocardia sp. DSM 110487]